MRPPVFSLIVFFTGSLIPADQGGPKATIRLVGNLFELELAKWTARSPYELRAYDMSKDASARQTAEQAFDRFKTSFARRIEQNCAT